MFRNRGDAGRRLARALKTHGADRPVVLGLLPGGVAVGYEIAEALRAPLDVLLVRRVPSRDDPGVAIGTVVASRPPHAFVSRDAIERLDLSDDYVRDACQRRLDEIERLAATYRAGRPKLVVAGRTVILADDGVASEGTLRVASKALRNADPARIVLALPVVPQDAVAALEPECDEIVALAIPEEIGRVDSFYEDWGQVSDTDVIDLMERAGRLR